MAYRRLAEGARNLIIGHLQANLPGELNAVAAAGPGNPSVTLEDPRQYYIYEKPKALNLPCVFVIASAIDFRISEMKANQVNARDRFQISILVEDQDAEMLTVKCDRYLSALHSTLDLAEITATDGFLSLRVVVYRATFSPVFMRDEVNSSAGDGGAFRKECVLECEVEHIEKN
jgi:hypothetical protein